MGTLPVRHDPASAAVVRRELAAQLRRLRVDQRCIDDAILVASELVANAIRHAAPVGSADIAVSWALDATGVVINVEDGSDVAPQPRQAHDRAPDGRGLAIVDALAAEWGVDRTGHGKRVWARVPIRH